MSLSRGVATIAKWIEPLLGSCKERERLGRDRVLSSMISFVVMTAKAEIEEGRKRGFVRSHVRSADVVIA